MSSRQHVVRFTVFDTARSLRAATWRCWASRGKGKDDVYIAPREAAGAIKASLHESGLYQVSYADEFVRKAEAVGRWRGESRHWDRWQRPEELGPGVTLVFRILVPQSAVFTPATNLPDDMVRIPAPAAGQAREVSVLITSVDAVCTGWPGKRGMDTGLVGDFELDGGEHVWVVERETDIPRMKVESGIMSKLEPNWNAVGPEDELRAVVFGEADDGSRFLIDARVEGRPGAASG